MGQYVEKLIPKSVKFLSLDRKIPLHNNGTPIRNWLHADDTAEAVITVIEQNAKNEIYNVCGGFEQSNLDTVNQVITLVNKSENNIENYIDFSCARPGQDVRYALDDSKLRTLGWSPKRVFSQELPEIVKYYKHNFIW
jgi:dTDP-glucose 4,6-dehydratase